MNYATCVISLIGLLFAIVYTTFVPCKAQDEQTIKSDAVTGIPIGLSDRELLLKDYEITNQEIERREDITLVVGSILIAAAFLIASQPFLLENEKLIPIAALASIVLYLLWAFVLHLTTKNIDDIAYTRIHVLEERIGALAKPSQPADGNDSEVQITYNFGTHKFLQDQLGNKWWMQIRRRFWGFIFVMLCIYWILIAVFY